MAAIIDQTPLRQAEARAGGVMALCRELGVTRQTFYQWQKDGGAGALAAILIARLTGVDPYALCREQDHGKLDLVRDYYTREA